MKILRYIAALALLALLYFATSCNKEEDNGIVPPSDSLQPASLSLNLMQPQIEQHTRGVADSPYTPEGWSLWEQAVDGQLMYRITLFIIDSKGTLVAMRDLYPGSSHLQADDSNYGANGFLASDGNSVSTTATTCTAAVANFRYDHPQNGGIERLGRGTYTLMAVANYSAYTATDGTNGTRTYSGLTDLETAINNIKASFTANPTTGIANFLTTANGSTLNNYRLDAGTDYVAPRTPQPLTLVQQIELHPGDNTVSAQLVRTYARIRIEVESHSGTHSLLVKNLDLSNNFAARYTYLFREDYTLAKGRPSVNTTDAIVPFSETLSIDKVGNSNNQAVVFDAYILENKDETNKYTYTLDMEYETGQQAYTLSSTSYISQPSGVADGGLYLIFNNNRSRYLMANGNNVSAGQLGTRVEGMEVDAAYVWKLVRRDNNQYYLQTASETEYYIDNPTTSSLPLDPLQSVYFTFSSNNGINMRSSGSGTRYISMDNSYNVEGASYTGQGTRFRFYPVAISGGAIGYDSPITLTTIDPITGSASEVTGIRRNDFIDVLITVSYNHENDEFEFTVNPWEKKEGDIEFN